MRYAWVMPRSAEPTENVLTPELERLAVRALAEDYDQLNYTLFSNKLRRPQLQLSEGRGRLGCWDGQHRVLWIARHLLLEQTWGGILEVLKHEMAHQFVSEVLGAQDDRIHGSLFQRICAERGIDGRARGSIQADSGSDAHVMTKITRLLSLAQSENANEAQAAMAAAQRLMLKYNIELSQNLAARDFVFAHLGEPTGRVNESQRILAAILREFFFVEVLWVSAFRPLQGKRGSVLEVCGTRANVELAEYVHAFLNRNAEHLWVQHQRDHGVRGNADRRQFVAGVMTGFYKKLEMEREPARQEGLVWLGDPELDSYFRRRYPRTRQVSYATSTHSRAHAAGRSVGEKLVLHRGVQGSGSGKVRLLK